ncbi:MAG TPA: two-component regulator propeller domain-containing protein, partial [Chitinophagaceae bacterium]|nr:two-component regulator propeller domain-containing protein [Chitinophagaceae bacterium]
MRLRGTILFLILIYIATITGNAQQLRMTSYTVNDGLLSNSIRKIFQDSSGNIWISTVDGLSKYDGYRFTNYTRANGLPHSLVNDMLEIAGTLVFACNDGSIAWMRHDRIVKVTTPGAVINQFCKVKSGKVLVATDVKGIQEFKDGQLHEARQPFPKSNYYSLAEINNNLLLAGSDSCVELLTNEYKLVKRFGGQATYYGGNNVMKDSRGRLWASHLPDPVQLSSDSGIYPPLNIPELKDASVEQVFEDKAGNIWFAGIYGLVQLSPEGQVRTIKKKNGLLSDAVSCVFQDREDNLWIGTSLGLCKMPATTVITTFDEADGLAYPTINAIFTDKENKLIAVTIKGWQSFDEKSGRFSPLLNPNSLFYVIHRQLAFYPALYTDAGQPVLKNTKAGRDLEKFFRQQRSRAHISRMAGDQRCYFISIGWKFYIYDGNKVFEDTSLLFSRRSNYTITGLTMDRNGSLWVGTWEEGLFRLEFSIDKGQFRFTKKTVVLPAIAIRSLMMDRQGNIWAGTRYNGVYRLSQAPGGHYKTDKWNTDKGLASNFVHELYQDEKNNIWLVYQDGVDKLVNKNDTFRVFNFSRVNNFFGNINHILPAGNGSLWLGTFNGLVRIKDGEMENKPPWEVDITSIIVGDSSYIPESMPALLSHKSNSLRIDFSAPTYLNENQVLYSYRLLGSGDTAWSHP